MKYLLFSLAAICFTFSAIKYFRRSTKNKEASVEVKSTTVKFSKSLIDVGENKLHSTVTANFVVYNTGSNDLYIQNVTPDCHCTVASFSEKPIRPNDSSII
jgi:hypothetical protein